MKAFTSSVVLCIALVFSGAAQAALIDRGGGLIYDTDLNVTWLSNANYGLGSSYDSADGVTDGRMSWYNAMNWASNLSYYDSVRNVTYNNWRLPTTPQNDATCSAYMTNCTGSEMGHLFYDELGGYVTGQSLSTLHNANYSLFQNLQLNQYSNFSYWSGTEYASSTDYAWAFHPEGGGLNIGSNTYSLFALAVRSGDIGAVPVPAAIWLLGSGLLGLIGTARRKTP